MFRSSLVLAVGLSLPSALLGCSREAAPGSSGSASAAPPPSASPSTSSSGLALVGIGGDSRIRLSDGGLLAGKPRAELMLVTTTGGVAHDDVERILRINRGRFRLCYAKVLVADVTLAGDAKVSFGIDPSGDAVRSRDAGPTIASPPLVDCVLRSVERLSFTPPDAGAAEVTASIHFSVEST